MTCLYDVTGSSAPPSDRLDLSMEPQLGWLDAEKRENLREENGEKLAYERLWYELLSAKLAKLISQNSRFDMM